MAAADIALSLPNSIPVWTPCWPTWTRKMPLSKKPAADEPNGFCGTGSGPELIQAVTDLGYTQPTAVQLQAIPWPWAKVPMPDGFIDLMVSSQTGSGKTAAFLLPVLHTLIKQRAVVTRCGRQTEFERLCASCGQGRARSQSRNKRKDPTNAP